MKFAKYLLRVLPWISLPMAVASVFLCFSEYRTIAYSLALCSCVLALIQWVLIFIIYKKKGE